MGGIAVHRVLSQYRLRRRIADGSAKQAFVAAGRSL
jgi:hypothetical protein